MDKEKLSVDRSQSAILNLQVLQRKDDQISEILSTASHVVLYEFNQTQAAWEKKEVEGCLFIVKRYTNPRFQMVVQNRLSTTNFMAPLELGMKMDESDTNFLILKCPASGGKQFAIYGIWFYPEDDRKMITNLLHRVTKLQRKKEEPSSINASSIPPRPPSSNTKNSSAWTTQTGQQAGQAILGMITGQAPASMNESSTPPPSLFAPSPIATQADASFVAQESSPPFSENSASHPTREFKSKASTSTSTATATNASTWLIPSSVRARPKRPSSAGSPTSTNSPSSFSFSSPSPSSSTSTSSSSFRSTPHTMPSASSHLAAASPPTPALPGSLLLTPQSALSTSASLTAAFRPSPGTAAAIPAEPPTDQRMRQRAVEAGVDREALKKTLLGLLLDDASFMDTIYAAYVRQVGEGDQ